MEQSFINPSNASLESRLLTPREVAEYLSLGRSTVYLLIQNGDLPSIRINRSVRVNPRDLEEYIELNTTRGVSLK
jgi:excisionase family DNA binding protein